MNRRLLSRLAPALLAGVLATTACTDTSSSATDGSDGGGLDPDNRTEGTDLSADEIVLTSGLSTVDSCDTLLERIKDEAFERVGPYGFDPGGFVAFEGDAVAIDREEAVDEEMAEGEALTTTIPAEAPTAASEGSEGAFAADDSAADTAAGGDGDFSGTNNQEQGVDEADLVKTDGRRLVVVFDQEMQVIDTTGDTPELIRTIRLPGETYGGELFLDGDRALLMTTGWTDRPFVDSSIPTDWYPGSPIGRLVEIDLATGDVVRTFEFEGSYLSAREIDGTIRIVLSASAQRLAWVYPSNEGAEDAAEQANRSLVESSTIDQWLPTYRITEGGSTVDEGRLVDCERVHLPGEFAGFGSLVVLTADLGDGLAITDSLSVFTDAQTVYASTDTVAVATPRWPLSDPRTGEPEGDGDSYTTALHTFDITDPDRAAYVASGSVRGHLLNRYSLSAHNGYLRVATTDGNPWGGGTASSESFVTVLETAGEALRPVGQVGGLGRGEQIFAVRFLGDLGYVVTYEQIDPLYTIDLSDPTDPEVLGELKIPGFSSYLHPLGEDHLLGVGTDGDDQGFTDGAAVSLFDVGDLANPELVTKLRFDDVIGLGQGEGEGDTYTPISGDPRAFTLWGDVALIPIEWYRWDPNGAGGEEQGSAVVLVRVDTAGTLTPIGQVSHPTIQECESGVIIEDVPTTTVESGDAEASFTEEEPPVTTVPGDYCYRWAPTIQRSIVIDDDLYTVSHAGVRVNAFDGLADIAWIPFR